MAAGIIQSSPAAAAIAAVEAEQIRLFGSAPFAEARRVAAWILSSHDNEDMQFIIADKVNARIFLFDGQGKLHASTPALLGLARGDDSPPGIGTRKLSAILPAERITPAGRFVASAGEDVGGKDLIWIDYDAAIALHRASDRKPGMGVKSRVERLSSTEPSERRVSLGCINVLSTFYDRYILPTFGISKGIVYILPETRSAAVEFNLPKIATTALPSGVPKHSRIANSSDVVIATASRQPAFILK